MKTKIILAVLASVAIISISASKIAKAPATSSSVSTASVGGLAAEDK